jgi:hypothetical protein
MLSGLLVAWFAPEGRNVSNVFSNTSSLIAADAKRRRLSAHSEATPGRHPKRPATNKKEVTSVFARHLTVGIFPALMRVL